MTDAKLPRERCDYSAIVDRPPLRLPGGARVAFWTIVNYEVWDIAKRMARQVLPAPTGQVLLPDVPNWSWHEYGMRVGFWRLMRALKKAKVTPTMSLNARVCETYPEATAALHLVVWTTESVVLRPVTDPMDRHSRREREVDEVSGTGLHC